MRGAYIYPEDFIELLSNLPEPASVVHAYLAGRFGILSTRNDPPSLWHAIVEQRGEESAEDVVGTTRSDACGLTAFLSGEGRECT
jgi:hypothetical protein